jgi:PAS domain S-box-containing protein
MKNGPIQFGPYRVSSLLKTSEVWCFMAHIDAPQFGSWNFATLADFVPQMVWMCTADGLNVYFNQRWVEYTGLTLEESRGRGSNTPFHPNDKQCAWDAWNHAVQSGEEYQVESRPRAADGSYRWFLMRGAPLSNADGEIARWFGTCTDIEELKQAEEFGCKQAEEAFQSSQARLQRVVDSAMDAIVSVDEQHASSCSIERRKPSFSVRRRRRLTFAPASSSPSLPPRVRANRAGTLDYDRDPPKI